MNLMRQLLFCLLGIISSANAQQTVFLRGMTLYPFIEFMNRMPDKEEFCKILTERDSIPVLQTTLNITSDYMVVFPEVKFDTISMHDRIIPKNLSIDRVLFINLETGERTLFFAPFFEGTVNKEEIINVEDLKNIESYVWEVICQWNFRVQSKQGESCIPKDPIKFRFDILVE